MLAISKMTDYATVLMSRLGKTEPHAQSASKLAQDTSLSLPTVSKLLKCLTNAGLLTSQRGTKGGYSLALASDEISIARIIEAVEGPIGLTACSKQGSCGFADQCETKESWLLLSVAIRQALEMISLQDMLTKSIATQNIQKVMQECLSCDEQTCHG